jgi:hypothetical protein
VYFQRILHRTEPLITNGKVNGGIGLFPCLKENILETILDGIQGSEEKASSRLKSELALFRIAQKDKELDDFR